MQSSRERTRAIGIALLLATVAVACLPPPPAPAGHIAPIIESIVVSPDPVTTGEPMTISVVATDDGPVSALTFDFNILAGPFDAGGYPGPGYTTLDAASAGCSPAAAQQIGENRVSVTRTCTVPGGSPIGEWRSSVTVSDGVPNGATGRVFVFGVR